MMITSQAFQALLLLSLFTFQVISDAVVTIQRDPRYSTQRVCAFDCWGTYTPGVYIASRISCPTSPPKNDCFCRTDLQQEANGYLSSCMNNRCSNANDIELATSMYDDYCTSNHYTGEMGAKPTGASVITITAAVATVKDTVTVTSSVAATTIEATVTATSTETETVTVTVASSAERAMVLSRTKMLLALVAAAFNVV